MNDTVATKGSSGNLTGNALLRTKLFIPQVRQIQDLLLRLFERLQNGLARKLTLISAPAGYGKTTLLAEWISHSGRTITWLSLDETDNDLTRFLTYFIAALQPLEADFGQALLTALQAPLLPPVESLMTAMVNEIIPLGEFALVLDDYHLIHLQAIHTAVAFLLNHLPPNMHLIIISRADPPLPLARLRVRGQLSELRAADLRFTIEEATTFFQQVKALPLPVAQIKELDTRTEGWSAGLHLAALSLQGLDAADMARFIHDFTGSHSNVFDYLAEEVLQQQPTAVQGFLLHTAVLNRLCAPLCDAVVGKAEGGRMQDEEHSTSCILHPSSSTLEYLEHANLFLISLDGRRHWYRYHHLFADFLRDRLTRENSQAAVNELYQRASGWFEQHSLLSEAIDYALLGQDFECAARLVDGHSERVRMQGELATLLRWLTALPDTAFEARPTLALNHAFTLAVMDQFMAAERRLAAAERALHAAPMRNVVLLGQAATVRAAIAQLTELPTAVMLAAGRQALELLPQSSGTWRGLAGMFLGVGYYAQAGDLAAGYQTLITAEQTSLDAGDSLGAINAATHLCLLLEIGGQLREVERISRANLQRATESFWQHVPLAAFAGFCLGRILYERNDLPAARDLLNESIQQLEAWVLKRPIVVSRVVLARVYHALGEPAHAHETLASAVAIVQKDDLKRTFAHWAEYRVRMALAQGDWTTPEQWTQEVEPMIQGDLKAEQEFAHITLALVYWAQQRLDDAQRLLDRLLPAAQAAARLGRVLEILLLQALTADAQGQRLTALTALTHALTIAEPEGYIRTFVDLGPAMAALLREAYARAIRPAYVVTLLAAFPDVGGVEKLLPPPASTLRMLERSLGSTQAPLVEPLSKRELEILFLLAQGLTNPEIAQQLYISDQTVKVHTRNIYGKLGVNGRREAVAKASALGLLV